MPWEFNIATPFKRSYKKLPDWLKEKIKLAMEELCKSNNPKNLGRLKRGKLEGTYGYDISKDCRILYTVDEALKVINFLRVCSHKEVYR